MFNFRKVYLEKKISDTLSYPCIVEMFRSAEKCGLFKEFSKDNLQAMERDKFYCFGGNVESVTKTISMETNYMFYNDLCIVIQHYTDSYIVRARVKVPNQQWCVDEEKNINTNYLEVYCWWSVDWMGFGHFDTFSGYKHGEWDEDIYLTISKIKKCLEESKEENIFAKVYTESKEEKNTITIPVTVKAYVENNR